MIEAGLSGTQEEHRMVIARNRAAVASQECAQHLVWRSEIDFVRRYQSESRLMPRFRLAKVSDVQHAMTQPLHMRRPVRQALERIEPRCRMRIVGSRRRRHFDPRRTRAPSNYF